VNITGAKAQGLLEGPTLGLKFLMVLNKGGGFWTFYSALDCKDVISLFLFFLFFLFLAILGFELRASHLLVGRYPTT
jgi:hypothetical protein